MVMPLWACILYFLFSWFLELFRSWIYLTDQTNKELKIYPSFLYVSIFQYEFITVSKFSLRKGVGEKGYRVRSKAWHQNLWMQWGKWIPQMKLLKRTVPWMKMLERIAVFLYFMIMQSCTTTVGVIGMYLQSWRTSVFIYADMYMYVTSFTYGNKYTKNLCHLFFA